ncbi:MAG: hypothetical protein CR982_02055 [Candidatus Cloacimonadota bacterium]|nr:MAG: hypothetical protein CR982_02055 [Candidatus Cloacimonadota bacterium]PIE78655.1 MAG: hypothetical protein CSA15_06700 [Candidatus Delongbacteria bacterium]
MSKNLDSIRLQQKKNLEILLKKDSIAEMLTVYFSDRSETYSHGIYSALIPNSEVKKCLKNISWDLSHEDGFPETSIYCNVPVYHRYGSAKGIEPLIFDRNFYGLRPDYKEINEEFRFFHNLFHDTKENKYIKINKNGTEEVIAVIEKNKIKIRLKEIRQFLAIKEMYLSIQFDFRENSKQDLQQLGLSSSNNKEVYNELEHWDLNFTNIPFHGLKGSSRLCGKKMIPPLPKSKSGMWGFEEEKPKQYENFIIGIDENGDSITYTANPDMLADKFGNNPDAPQYLTPVHFRKTVLDKYYRQSSKFSVEDNYLRCGSLWGLQIDNHHSDKVCVWLGDLGNSLPYEEQLYWKSYNILPVGNISDVYNKRQILARFSDSNQLDHIFKEYYSILNDACTKLLTWQILLPLSQEDLHYLSSVRIPSTEEQSEFDELILALTKILVDSLNEKQLNKFIPNEDKRDIKGSINRLKKVFEILNIKKYENHINFLRKLQNLRSSGIAHRKGSGYQKIANDFGIPSSSLIKIFEKILKEANDYLAFLKNTIPLIVKGTNKTTQATNN